jgi:hypothetical protein
VKTFSAPGEDKIRLFGMKMQKDSKNIERLTPELAKFHFEKRTMHGGRQKDVSVF